MGRRRRKIIKRQPKPFPTLFPCPLCNTQAVTVSHEGGDVAVVKCGNCGTSYEVPWYRSYMPVDAYSVWYDIVTGRRSAEDVKREIEERATRLAQVVEAASPEEVGEVPVSREGSEEGQEDGG